MFEHGEKLDSDPGLAILDGIPSMVAYWDHNLLCRFANQAFFRSLGEAGPSLPNKHLRDVLGPALFARHQPYVQAALAGTRQTFEGLVPAPDGGHRPGLMSYTPRVVDGQVVGLIAQVDDATALQQARTELQQRVQECAAANAALRQVKADLHLAQRLGEMGSWTWDIADDTVVWSPQLYAIFGLDDDRPPPTFGQHDLLYTPKSLALLRSQVEKAVEFGLPYTLDLQYLHRSGRTGWLEARGAAVRDASGRVVQLHGTAQEITARRMAAEASARAERIVELEQALLAEQTRHAVTPVAPLAPGTAPDRNAASERAAAVQAQNDPARLEAVQASGLLDSAQDGAFDSLTVLAASLLKVPASFISIVDSDRDFYKSQVGLPAALADPRELEGQTLCHFTLKRDDALVIPDTHADEVFRSVPSVQGLGVRSYVGIPIKLRGQNIGSFCVVDHVPRQWRADELEILRQISVSASREIELRAAVASAQQLAVFARAKALEKERFVAVVAHDLRTPLQVLQLAMLLLQKSPVKDAQAVLARMKTALGMMKTMVDGLIHPATADAPVVRQPLDVSVLLRDAVDMMSPMARNASIALSMGALPDAVVHVDYGQMLRVLGNLVGNALKYSPAGSAVTLGASLAGDKVLLTVADSGVGMDEDEVAKAFNHGWQSADGKARGDGAGLGLAIVKSLVEQQDGSVAIRSTPGVGTEVTVTLRCR